MAMGENNVALPNSQPISHLATYDFRVLAWKDASSRGRGHIRFLMFGDWFRSLKRLCGVTLNFLYLIQRAGLVDKGGKSETANLTLKLNGFSLHSPHFTILITFTLFVIVSKEILKKNQIFDYSFSKLRWHLLQACDCSDGPKLVHWDIKTWQICNFYPSYQQTHGQKDFSQHVSVSFSLINHNVPSQS